jgi:hypothetical protein
MKEISYIYIHWNTVIFTDHMGICRHHVQILSTYHIASVGTRSRISAVRKMSNWEPKDLVSPGTTASLLTRPWVQLVRLLLASSHPDPRFQLLTASQVMIGTVDKLWWSLERPKSEAFRSPWNLSTEGMITRGDKWIDILSLGQTKWNWSITALNNKLTS